MVSQSRPCACSDGSSLRQRTGDGALVPGLRGYHREFLRMGFLSHRHPKSSSRDHDCIETRGWNGIHFEKPIETFQLGECWPCWSVPKQRMFGRAGGISRIILTCEKTICCGCWAIFTLSWRPELGDFSLPASPRKRHFTGLSSIFPMKMEKHWKTIPLFCSNPDKSFIN
jgi:hypothetical protein